MGLFSRIKESINKAREENKERGFRKQVEESAYSNAKRKEFRKAARESGLRRARNDAKAAYSNKKAGIGSKIDNFNNAFWGAPSSSPAPRRGKSRRRAAPRRDNGGSAADAVWGTGGGGLGGGGGDLFSGLNNDPDTYIMGSKRRGR